MDAKSLKIRYSWKLPWRCHSLWIWASNVSGHRATLLQNLYFKNKKSKQMSDRFKNKITLASWSLSSNFGDALWKPISWKNQSSYQRVKNILSKHDPYLHFWGLFWPKFSHFQWNIGSAQSTKKAHHFCFRKALMSMTNLMNSLG